jgi:hypothetical protein
MLWIWTRSSCLNVSTAVPLITCNLPSSVYLTLGLCFPSGPRSSSGARGNQPSKSGPFWKKTTDPRLRFAALQPRSRIFIVRLLPKYSSSSSPNDIPLALNSSMSKSSMSHLFQTNRFLTHSQASSGLAYARVCPTTSYNAHHGLEPRSHKLGAHHRSTADVVPPEHDPRTSHRVTSLNPDIRPPTSTSNTLNNLPFIPLALQSNRPTIQ